MAKVLLINGSPKAKGCTYTALSQMVDIFNDQKIEAEIMHIGNRDVGGCIACNHCRQDGRCIIEDVVNVAAKKFEEADGLVVGAPVYYASPNGTLISFLDRLFYSTQFSKHMKVGACVINARRGGNTSSFDVLNKYFTISGMPIASSTYWNMTYGFTPDDVRKDREGMQTMRNLARNMSFMIKAINEAKDKYGLPFVETTEFTSFPDGK